MKKLLTMALILMMLITLTVVFVGCDNDDDTGSSSSQATSSTAPSHKHTYASEWTVTDTGHYKACTCHPDAVEISEHRDSVNRDGICDVCLYVMKEATTFSVTVKDDSGTPIEGVEIKIFTSSYDKTVATDENGMAVCDFVYFDEVKAIIQSVPEGYEDIVDTIYTFEGTELTIEINETVFFKVIVLDENGDGLAGVRVGFMIPFAIVETDENGVARFEMLKKDLGENTQTVFISELPEGYVLTDTPFNALFDIENNTTYTAHAALVPMADYTVSAKDSGGKPLKNAAFTFTKDGEAVGTVVTDDNGNATISLPTGEYSVKIAHLNSFYTVIGESTVVLTAENSSYEATFEESTGYGSFTLNISYSDGTEIKFGDIQVYVYKPNSYNTYGLLGTPSNGAAVTNSYNEDLIFLVIDKDHNYSYVHYNKGDANTFYVVLERGNTLGKSEENPVPINAILDLPFSDSTKYVFEHKHFLSAGESLYVEVWNALGRTVTLNGNTFTLEYNGKEIAAGEDGKISLTFKDILPQKSAVIKITAKEDATEDIDIDSVGAIDNPFSIVIYPDSSETKDLTFVDEGHEIYLAVSWYDDTAGILNVGVEGVEVTFEGIPEGSMSARETVIVKVIGSEAGNATVTFTVEPVVE